MKVMADTHVLVWMYCDPDRLSGVQREAIESTGENRPLHVSDISIWEIAMLVDLGRIQLKIPLRDWLEVAFAPPHVQRHGISPAIAARTVLLPDTFHRDPADRILVSTAQNIGATLLTNDQKIIDAKIVNTLS